MLESNVKVIVKNGQVASERLKYLSVKYNIIKPSFKWNEKQSINDTLKQLPICNKSDLIKYAKNNKNKFLTEGVLFSETSGSTGEALPTPRNQSDIRWNILNQIFAYKKYLSPGVDRIAIIHPSILSPFVEATALALHELSIGYIRIFPIPNICNYQRIFDSFKRYDITSIMTTPSLAYKVLYELKKIGKGTLPSSLRHVLLTGEYISLDGIKNMDNIVGNSNATKPFVYGASETAVLMHGNIDSTYQPFLEDFIFEIHPLNSFPTETEKDSTTGRLVVSWLREGLLPIVRYNTGDIFTVLGDKINGGYVFKFEGREKNNGLDISIKKSIEKVLLGVCIPIYHYDCYISSKTTDITINIILDDQNNINVDFIKEQLLSIIKKQYRIRININPKNHSFYNFSPFPKTKKIISC